MKITAIERYLVSVPLEETFWRTWIPGYPQTHNSFTLVKLVTDEGIEGYSAGTTMGIERQELGDLIGGYLLGSDPTDIETMPALLKQAGLRFKVIRQKGLRTALELKARKESQE